MKFSEFKGNERIVEYFKKAVESQNLAHAYLFSGPEGVGKSTLAMAISKALLCPNRTKDGACEKCAACHKFDSENHADFHHFVPEGLYFKIDEVRRIIHEVSLRPIESRWKVFLLERVDYMRDEPSNALLKVLEEPPGDAVFILITEVAEVLLPTVRSRCQQFSFQPLAVDDVAELLVEKMEFKPKEAAELAQFSHGSPGRALNLSAKQGSDIRDRVLATLEAALAPRSYFNLIDAVRAITVERTEMGERFLMLEELTRDLILLKMSDDAKLIHQDAKDRLTPLAERVSMSSLVQFYEKLLETREAVMKVNANIGLSLQALFLPLRLQS
jgi:DNA polymerase III subunit delta'